MSPFIPSLLGIILLLSLVPCVLAATSQFKEWYPEFRSVFELILHTNCTHQYTIYLAQVHNSSNIDRFTEGDRTNQLAQPVVNCILGDVSEFIKANMASAGVLLGLTPTILAALGNSVDETSLLSIVARRPVLALCLAAGSPAVFPLRSFVYPRPIKAIKERERRLRRLRLSYTAEMVVVSCEWLMTIAALVNIVTLCWQLGCRANFTFAPHVTYLPLLWTVLGMSPHIFGSWALRLRISVSTGAPCKSLLDLLAIQVKPLSYQRPITVKLQAETYLFIGVSWFTSVLIVCHIIYGTLVFSSVLFVSVRDTLTIIARYMASVICCRIILMYELSSLRDSYNFEGDHESFEDHLLYSKPSATVSRVATDLSN